MNRKHRKQRCYVHARSGVSVCLLHYANDIDRLILARCRLVPPGFQFRPAKGYLIGNCAIDIYRSPQYSSRNYGNATRTRVVYLLVVCFHAARSFSTANYSNRIFRCDEKRLEDLYRYRWRCGKISKMSLDIGLVERKFEIYRI